MGGIGSGRRKELIIDDAAKKLIRGMRCRGYTWEEIAKDLGFKSPDPLYNFRLENPDFEKECSIIYGNLKMSLHDRYVKAALPENGPANASMANRLAEKFGIIDAEKPSTAIQMNAMGGAGIQVAFIEPGQLPPSPAEVAIDAEADSDPEQVALTVQAGSL